MSDSPKTIGSLFINASRDATPAVKQKIEQITAYLRENGYFSISVNPTRMAELPANAKGYLVLKGYTNKFNEGNFYITHESLANKAGGNGGGGQAKASPVQAAGASGITLEL